MQSLKKRIKTSKFTRKHPQWSPIFNKVEELALLIRASLQVLPSELQGFRNKF